MKEVIHDKEPRYEETTLVSETGSGKEPSFSLSCCSKPHIYHTGTSPERKKASQAAMAGCRLAQVTR